MLLLSPSSSSPSLASSFVIIAGQLHNYICVQNYFFANNFFWNSSQIMSFDLSALVEVQFWLIERLEYGKHKIFFLFIYLSVFRLCPCACNHQFTTNSIYTRVCLCVCNSAGFFPQNIEMNRFIFSLSHSRRRHTCMHVCTCITKSNWIITHFHWHFKRWKSRRKKHSTRLNFSCLCACMRRSPKRREKNSIEKKKSCYAPFQIYYNCLNNVAIKYM